MGSVLFKTILGISAGILAWALVEPFKPDYLDQAKWSIFEKFLMFAWGTFIGGAVGFSSGWQRGSKIHALRELALGALFGCIGIGIGQGLAAPFVPMINGPLTIVGRTLTLTMIAAGLGAGIGFSTFVPRRGLQGLIGGAIGGAASGFLFDIVGGLLTVVTLTAQGITPGTAGETGGPSRALAGAMMGGFIALMIGIIEAISKSAWLRLELGRNEGKEWVIDKPVMNIGRDERADIPIFGDTGVTPLHAAIHKRGAQYILVDQSGPIGVGVNGQRVQQQVVLNPNDVIQIGAVTLRFITKNVKAPARNPEAMRNMAYAINSGAPQQPVQPIQQQPYGQQPVGQQPYGQPHSGQPMGQPIQQPYGQVPMGQVPLGQPAMDPTIMNPGAMQPMRPISSGFSLVAMDGPLMGQRFPLNMPIEMGRESAQIPMANDGSASRRHARVEVNGIFVTITDLGSTNGTFLNGQRITNGSAKNGDILKVGATNFRIES